MAVDFSLYALSKSSKPALVVAIFLLGTDGCTKKSQYEAPELQRWSASPGYFWRYKQR
jgi:hypothetical protein